MWSSKDWTHRFTGRMSTLLAKHGLKASFHSNFRIFSIPKSLNPDPVLRAPVACIFLANMRKIIFHCTRGNTSLTSRTKILVDRHAPFTGRLICDGTFCTHSVKVYAQTHNLLLYGCSPPIPSP